MEDFSNIVNWGSVSNQSSSFKNQTPFPFAFIEEFLKEIFMKNFMKHILRLMKHGRQQILLQKLN